LAILGFRHLWVAKMLDRFFSRFPDSHVFVFHWCRRMYCLVDRTSGEQKPATEHRNDPIQGELRLAMGRAWYSLSLHGPANNRSSLKRKRNPKITAEWPNLTLMKVTLGGLVFQCSGSGTLRPYLTVGLARAIA
jgi:hypothetical protein